MQQLPPQVEQWLAQYYRRIETLVAGGFKPTPTNAREGLAALTSALVTQKPEIAWVQDDLVPGGRFQVPVRIYHPAPATRLPVLIYFHGGGHMAGSVTVYDPICRNIARSTRHVVVSADYRLAPECPYPAGVQDAWQVVRHVFTTLARRHLNFRQRLSIAGDSGGGALCATVAHQAQDDPDVDLHSQVLIYPSLDYTLSCESVQQYGTGYFLEAHRIRWYFDNYFQHGEDRRAASPLFMPFSGRMPRTLVITAGFCPLRDEGAAYAEKVKSAGVETVHVDMPDMLHAFLNMEEICQSACRSAYDRMAGFLNARPGASAGA